MDARKLVAVVCCIATGSAQAQNPCTKRVHIWAPPALAAESNHSPLLCCSCASCWLQTASALPSIEMRDTPIKAGLPAGGCRHRYSTGRALPSMPLAPCLYGTALRAAPGPASTHITPRHHLPLLCAALSVCARSAIWQHTLGKSASAQRCSYLRGKE